MKLNNLKRTLPLNLYYLARVLRVGKVHEYRRQSTRRSKIFLHQMLNINALKFFSLFDKLLVLCIKKTFYE